MKDSKVIAELTRKRKTMNGTHQRAPLCSVCNLEQFNRLTKNKATLLAFRYLHPADEHDQEDAFDGLVGLCWAARGYVSILPTWSELAQGQTEYTCTKEFIEDFVLGYLEPYQGQSEQEILDAALADKFRYIGRRLWSRMRDEIGKRSALTNQEPYRQSLVGVEARMTDYDSTAGYTSTLSNFQPRYITTSTPLDYIRARQTTLTGALGEKNYVVLEAQAEALEVFPEAFEGTGQAAKSALTRAIARRRAVSEQQARSDKRQLLTRVSEEMQRGNRALNDLHAFLARGDDEHTLRETHISGDGRRKRSTVLHIVLPDKKLWI